MVCRGYLATVAEEVKVENAGTVVVISSSPFLCIQISPPPPPQQIKSFVCFNDFYLAAFRRTCSFLQTDLNPMAESKGLGVACNESRRCSPKMHVENIPLLKGKLLNFTATSLAFTDGVTGGCGLGVALSH